VIAAVQFLIFLLSLGLIFRTLTTGQGATAAAISVVAKTLALYTVMITGAIWEHEIFGRYLFAPSFFWEDFVSMFVIALHTAYLYALLTGALPPREQLLLALVAYASYTVNALQFLFKFRRARREAIA
jgi:3-vinyl bacteriochlorophyllide hydratase